MAGTRRTMGTGSLSSGVADRSARRDPRRASLSRRRRWAFAVVAMLLPVLGVLLVEGGLRLVGVGHSDPLFVAFPEAEGYAAANPTAIRRFLAGHDDPPNLRIKPVPFRSGKPPETFRIVVQGGSTAAGYPYGYGASLAAMLRQRLQRTFPERRIEVIPTAVAAINTYALLDFSGEILEREPDAVVLYAGHNEYLGILGAGSTFSAGRRRALVLAFLAFDDWRLLQLGRRFVADLSSDGSSPEPHGRRTLMARVVAEDRIAYGSELYRRGLEQYRANLQALLHRYDDAGVPVYVGTLASNVRDQPPFVAGFGDGADTHTWRRSRMNGEHALWRGDAEAALEAFDAAVAADDLHAEGHFWRGRALEALERYDEAREAYRAAKDRDMLRFRAPEAMNGILRQVASEEGARVVEVRDAFVRGSPHGLVGRDLMLEHLHPNVEGYFLLADAFYEALRADGAIGEWTDAVAAERARREIPLNAVERQRGEYRVARLTAGWPFDSLEQGFRLPPAETRVERIAQGLYRGSVTWSDAMQRLLDHHRSEGETVEAARVAALLADLEPHEPDRQRVAADLLRAAGRPDHQVYRRRARESDTSRLAEN